MKAVAVKKGQSRVEADFQEMGTLRCDGCGEEFVIGQHHAFIDKRLANEQAHWLERVLAEEHERGGFLSIGKGSAGPWHLEPIFVDFETLDFRIERSCGQPEFRGGADGPETCP